MDSRRDPNPVYLLAVDGSEHAHAAACMLADLLSGSLREQHGWVQLLAVFTPVQATELQPLRETLQVIETIFTQKSIPVKTELILGSAAEKIIEFGDRLNPSMVIMGARGLRATLGILLGGVAQQVVEYGRWPVLVVRAPYAGLNRILAVTDGSACSRKAAGFLTHLNLPDGVEYHLLHVLPPVPPEPSLTYYARAWPVGAEILPPVALEADINARHWLEEEEKLGQALLDDIAGSLSERGIKVVSAMLRGDAATEIIEYAAQNRIDLIVSGSRGLTRIKSWLLGSVSRKLVHYAGCSVLIVRETACT